MFNKKIKNKNLEKILKRLEKGMDEKFGKGMNRDLKFLKKGGEIKWEKMM